MIMTETILRLVLNQSQGYDLGGYDFDSPMDSYSPEYTDYTFSITPSPEEQKIERSRKGNK
jgi:hypothetical protein